MIKVEHLHKTFHSGVFKKHAIQAVYDVSFCIEKGKTLGITGNSGCGKSTLARMLLKLLEPDSGEIYFNGKSIALLTANQTVTHRQKAQIIFQSPENSLDPSKKILYSLMEPLLIHQLFDNKQQGLVKIDQMLALVGISKDLLFRYPHQISGGEAQRIMISRALLLNPEFLILDEPTSMLDVSVQAHIMNILKDLQSRLQLTYLLISHDLDILKWLSNDIAVMHEGRIVEHKESGELIGYPQHPYTRSLIGNFYLP